MDHDDSAAADVVAMVTGAVTGVLCCRGDGVVAVVRRCRCRGDRCSDGSAVEVPAVQLLVMVVDAETPTIIVNGIRSQAVDDYELTHGVHLFPDLIIDATTRTEHSERNNDQHSHVRRSLCLSDCLSLAVSACLSIDFYRSMQLC